MLKTLESVCGTLSVKYPDLNERDVYLDGELKYKIFRCGSIVRVRSGVEVTAAHTRLVSGYLKTSLFGVEEYIHRIIAYFFCDNPDNKRTVNHIDGDKSNNDAQNLEWVSYSENHKHAYDFLGRVAGAKGKRSGRGWCFDKSRGKWMSYYDGPDKRTYLGRFNTEQEAVSALYEYTKCLKGDNAAQDIAKAMTYKRFREGAE